MANRVLQGRFQITTVSVVSPTEWQCIGNFYDNYAKFSGLDVGTEFSAGETLYIFAMSPSYGDVDRFKISAVNSAAAVAIDVNVVYDETTPMANPAGQPLPGNTLLALMSDNTAAMTPVMISSLLDERLYNYARNVNDEIDPASGHLVDLFTLDATDISNKYVDVSGTIATIADTVMLIAGAPNQFYGVDFTVTASPSRVSWNGTPLDGVLSTGDNLTILYK